MVQGDMTEIGERGINISGGQKARVDLARAVYQNCDIYLLDDILSALDVHVGQAIFENVIMDLLCNKTVILATNHVHLLHNAHRILLMYEGQILDQGTFEDLSSRNADIIDLLMKVDGKSPKLQFNPLDSDMDSTPSDSSFIELDPPSQKHRSEPENDNADGVEKTMGTLVQDEELFFGAVKSEILLDYLRGYGSWGFIVVVLFAYVVQRLVQTVSDLWVMLYTNNSDNSSQPSTIFGLSITVPVFLFIFSGIVIVHSFIGLAKGMVASHAAKNAAKVKHEELLDSVVRAPMSYFDTTPSGRLMNRFGKDMSEIDLGIPYLQDSVFTTVTNILISYLFVALFVPVFGLLGFLPIFALFLILHRPFRRGCVELFRLEVAYRSVLLHSISEGIEGVSTIRSYNSTNEFVERNDKCVDNVGHVMYTCWYGSIYLKFLMSTTFAIIGIIAVVCIVALQSSIKPGIAAICLMYVIQIQELVNIFVMLTTHFEASLNAVERIVEARSFPKEALLVNLENPTPKGWPHSGYIIVQDYSMRYRPGLDLVLKDINIEIQSGEKVCPFLSFFFFFLNY